MKKDYIFKTKLSVRDQQDFIFNKIKSETRVNIESGENEEMISLLKEEKRLIVELERVRSKIKKSQREKSKCTHQNAKIEKYIESYGCDWDGYSNYSGVSLDCKICGKSAKVEICMDQNNLEGVANVYGDIDLVEFYSIENLFKAHFEKSIKASQRREKLNNKNQEEELYKKLHKKYGTK